MCVRERERERERRGERERERERVCVCVCERERGLSPPRAPTPLTRAVARSAAWLGPYPQRSGKTRRLGPCRALAGHAAIAASSLARGRRGGCWGPSPRAPTSRPRAPTPLEPSASPLRFPSGWSATRKRRLFRRSCWTGAGLRGAASIRAKEGPSRWSGPGSVKTR